MMAWERDRRLKEKLNYLQELEKVKNFDWDDWRKRFLKHHNNKKSRVTDLFRKLDEDGDGFLTRDDFIDGILKNKFPSSRLEMNAVADKFDHGDGMIDWREFIAALRPDWQDRGPLTDMERIDDEINRQVALCTCRQKFKVFQVGEGKYRVSWMLFNIRVYEYSKFLDFQFGDSQKLRLVRILRSTVMVRVGGGWCALDEFLIKNDPCRGKYFKLILRKIKASRFILLSYQYFKKKDHMSEELLIETRAEAARLTRLIISHARLARRRRTSVPFTYNLN